MRRTGCALSLLVSSSALACSGGGSTDSGSSSGASGSSSGASTNPNCSFSGTLTGGVSDPTIEANGCGTAGGNVFTVTQADFATGTSLGVRVFLVTPLKGGETGAQPLEKLDIFQREAKGQPEVVWSGKSCSF